MVTRSSVLLPRNGWNDMQAADAAGRRHGRAVAAGQAKEGEEGPGAWGPARTHAGTAAAGGRRVWGP